MFPQVRVGVRDPIRRQIFLSPHGRPSGVVMDDHSKLETSLRGQLDTWDLVDSPEGRQALDIAHRLHATEDLRPAAAAMLHAQLRALMTDLRGLAPDEAPSDGVSDLQDEYEGLKAVPDL